MLKSQTKSQKSTQVYQHFSNPKTDYFNNFYYNLNFDIKYLTILTLKTEVKLKSQKVKRSRTSRNLHPTPYFNSQTIDRRPKNRFEQLNSKSKKSTKVNLFETPKISNEIVTFLPWIEDNDEGNHSKKFEDQSSRNEGEI